nr:MAG TPA: hypothetical protein [Caudoviricetes sp.]
MKFVEKYVILIHTTGIKVERTFSHDRVTLFCCQYSSKFSKNCG